MQTSTDKVELAVMHVLETDPSSADMAVMSQRNPLHTFMFDSRGKLLNANKAAFEAFQSDPPSALAAHCLVTDSWLIRKTSCTALSPCEPS